MGNSNAFKAIIALIVIMFGVFAVINYTGTGQNRAQGPSNIEDSSSHVNDTRGEGEQEVKLSAKEMATIELCDCFKEILDLRSKIEEEPRLEFEWSSKIKKAEINMRSCYTKAKQRHSAFGNELIEDFKFTCPDAQEEL